MDMLDLGQSGSLLSLFSDSTRVRLLTLLEAEELTVAELVDITELSQSRVSTHLGKLREAGLLRDRRAGSSTYYRLAEASMPDEARRVWELLKAQLDDPIVKADARRTQTVLRAREGAGWPDRIAGQMERHYSPGRTWESLSRAFLALMDLGDVLDVGAGDGTIAQLLAPQARSITCVDKSDKLVSAAVDRLAPHAHVSVERADMHALPFEGASFDLVLLSNVLAYSERPEVAIAEGARVLRPGGRLLVTTLAPHEHRGLTEGYGHVNAGISSEELRVALEAAGLEVDLSEVTSRERKKPHFRVVTALGRRPQST
jgi:ArsR family transcriptional regulator